MPTKDADLNNNNTTIILFKTLNKMQITPLKLQVILILSPKVSRSLICSPNVIYRLDLFPSVHGPCLAVFEVPAKPIMSISLTNQIMPHQLNDVKSIK